MLLTRQCVPRQVHSPRQFPQQLCSISTPCCVVSVQWSSVAGVLWSRHTFSHPRNRACQLRWQKHKFSWLVKKPIYGGWWSTYLPCAWWCVRRAASGLCGEPPCWQWWRSRWSGPLMTLYVRSAAAPARSYALRIPQALSSFPPGAGSQRYGRTHWHLDRKEETVELFCLCRMHWMSFPWLYVTDVASFIHHKSAHISSGWRRIHIIHLSEEFQKSSKKSVNHSQAKIL